MNARGKIMRKMIERSTQGKLTWINLFKPSAEEIREVMLETGITPEFAGDLNAPIPRSFTIGNGCDIKLVFDYPFVKRTDLKQPHEIKLIATKKYFVSVHYEDIEAFHRFKKEFELLAILKNPKRKATGVHLMLAMVSTLYEALNAKLDYLESKIGDIQGELFSEHEKEMVFEISQVGRRSITFKQTVAAHQKVLDELHECIVVAYGNEHKQTLADIKNQYAFIQNRIRTINETLYELRETNFALLTTKQNEIMKILTIMAFITFPLTLFTSTFGMNTISAPIIGRPNDFWIIVGVMAIVSTIFFAYFKYKRWM